MVTGLVARHALSCNRCSILPHCEARIMRFSAALAADPLGGKTPAASGPAFGAGARVMPFVFSDSMAMTSCSRTNMVVDFSTQSVRWEVRRNRSAPRESPLARGAVVQIEPSGGQSGSIRYGWSHSPGGSRASD